MKLLVTHPVALESQFNVGRCAAIK